MSGFKCNQCAWSGEEPERVSLYLVPALEEVRLIVCPECRHVETSLEICCEEPGCTETASMGTPAKSGYKRHCHHHPPKDQT